MQKICLILVFLGFAPFAPNANAIDYFKHAQKTGDAEIDQYDQEALEKTQELLREQKLRDAAIQGDAKATEADKKAGALAGSPANKQKMYEISSDVMAGLTKMTGGDTSKMNKILEEAQKNPEAFYKRLMSDQNKAEVKNLANDIEKNQKPALKP